MSRTEDLEEEVTHYRSCFNLAKAVIEKNEEWKDRAESAEKLVTAVLEWVDWEESPCVHVGKSVV